MGDSSIEYEGILYDCQVDELHVGNCSDVTGRVVWKGGVIVVIREGL